MLNEIGANADAVAAIASSLTLGGGLVVFGRNWWESRRGQASHVSAWFEAAAPVGDELGAVLHIRNRSDQPIYDVRVWGLRIVAESKHLGVLQPSDHHQEPCVGAFIEAFDETSVNLVLYFVDARGRKWIRSGHNARLRRRWRPMGMAGPREYQRIVKAHTREIEQAGDSL